MSVVSRAAGKLAAQNIKNETAISANTATRVGGNMEDGWDTFALDADLTVVENTAIFESDTSLAGASFFLDEDDMSSDSATKVASQQSVKAYVDYYRTESFIISCSDLTTALTTGTTKGYFRMPYAFTLTDVRASVLTAPTGSGITIGINESGSTILSTDITIDATTKTSEAAATPPVISDSSLADDAEITIDIDAVGSTIAGVGLIVTLIGYKT